MELVAKFPIDATFDYPMGPTFARFATFQVNEDHGFYLLYYCLVKHSAIQGFFQ